MVTGPKVVGDTIAERHANDHEDNVEEDLHGTGLANKLDRTMTDSPWQNNGSSLMSEGLP